MMLDAPKYIVRLHVTDAIFPGFAMLDKKILARELLVSDAPWQPKPGDGKQRMFLRRILGRYDYKNDSTRSIFRSGTMLRGLKQVWSNEDSGLICFGGWYSRHDADGTVSAFNINVLRRHAPWAYFFFPNYKATLDDWIDENAADPCYVNSLDTRPVPRLPSPLVEGELAHPIWVAGIRTGDVGGIIDLVTVEEQVLVCLPLDHALVGGDRILQSASDNRTAAIQLMRGGGFGVTVIDGMALRVWTLDPVYAQYFWIRSGKVTGLPARGCRERLTLI